MDFTALYSGEEAATVLQVVADTLQLPEVASKPYELRVLRAPSLDLLAVWLHGDDDDLLFPVRAPKKLRSKAMTESQLVNELRPVARQRVKPKDIR